MKMLPLVALLAALTLPLSAQKMATPAGEAPGPWILGTIGVGKGEDPKTPKTTALKGIAIKVGDHGEAAVAYDLDLCRVAGAWTGKFTTPMNLMSRGDYPTAMGEVQFTTGPAAGFMTGGQAQLEWKDARSEPYGPLPPGQARFKGFSVNGNKTILKWEISGTEVLEMPGYDVVVNGGGYFTRTFCAAPSVLPVQILVAANPPADNPFDVAAHHRTEGAVAGLEDKERVLQSTPWVHGEHGEVMIWAAGDPEGSTWRQVNGQLALEVAPHAKPATFQIAYWTAPASDPDGRTAPLFYKEPPIDLPALLKGGPAHWPEPVVTEGDTATAKADAAYVVDTIKVPEPNPWGAPMFIGGFDFFPDGRAAVCTFHGDVFIVSGIDDTLGHVTWKRFASGLYHALGLKIVNGDIYVTCRDGLWRLRDLNGDGEADSYEAFNFDLKVTKSFHEFVFDLQTDPGGNFYFAKAGPVKNGGRGFDEIMAQHGTFMRVSPDGAKLDGVATGFRAPNGIGCGPHGELTSGDNEGTWTPMCKINWIKSGGFYGVVPLAHRDPPPTDYDRPLCWMPKRVDNSSGGQVWVPDDERWGPWRGQLLHTSYGTCSLFGVLKEEVDGSNVPSATSFQPATIMQGGVTRFPVNFQSGIMRARFNPQDGQLYVAGLRGWQTTAVKNGCFQRVRYQAGPPVRMPIGLHATKRGVRLDFACELDAASAGDVQNWNVEVWNYIWSSAYGSPEISTMGPAITPGEAGKDGDMQYTKEQMAQKKHDPLTVKSATISADKKSVFLEIPEIKPVMQMAIKFGIQSADGGELRSEVINTIHALANE
ncbi:MAG: hypothetical protein P4L99_25215 [Chthoniobacter sp.]|nr:hypothetical protein [Chthoniobacter sp.]